jgi:hypothetical protein
VVITLKEVVVSGSESQKTPNSHSLCKSTKFTLSQNCLFKEFLFNESIVQCLFIQ